MLIKREVQLVKQLGAWPTVEPHSRGTTDRKVTLDESQLPIWYLRCQTCPIESKPACVAGIKHAEKGYGTIDVCDHTNKDALINTGSLLFMRCAYPGRLLSKTMMDERSKNAERISRDPR